MDKIQSLQIFVAIVESGSLGKAAEQLNLHLSVVSRSLKNLEIHLGTKLLNRTTRRLSLTAEGEIFYNKCLILLDELEQTFQGLSDSTRLAQGNIRVDIPPVIIPYIITQLPKFQQQYPDISLIISSTDKIIDLIDEGIDCSLRIGHLQDSSYIARYLCDMEMILCASPDYLQRHGTPHHIDDLISHRAIYYFSNKNQKLFKIKLSQNQQIYDVKTPIAMLVNDSNALLQGLLASIGISYVPKLLVEPYLKNGQLQQIMADYEIESRPLWLMYPQRKFVSQRLTLFWDWLIDIFK